MGFLPNAGDTLVLEGREYRFAPNPRLPGDAYGQEGRRAVVYQLATRSGDIRALKIFRHAFRTSRLERTAFQLSAFAALPCLEACKRTVVTWQSDPDLIRAHPDLEHAVVMPWIDGRTWQEWIVDRAPLTSESADALARTLARALSTLEGRGVAHGDLSGANLIVRPELAEAQLVDVDDLFGPGLPQPEVMSNGSPGYAHARIAATAWSPAADRFAAAILFAEILGWCDERVRAASADEHYFDSGELQTSCERYRVLHEVLLARCGKGIASFFERAWNSASVHDCPPLSAWARQFQIKPAAAHVAPAAATGVEMSDREIPRAGPRWTTQRRIYAAVAAAVVVSLIAVAAVLLSSSDEPDTVVTTKAPVSPPPPTKRAALGPGPTLPDAGPAVVTRDIPRTRAASRGTTARGTTPRAPTGLTGMWTFAESVGDARLACASTGSLRLTSSGSGLNGSFNLNQRCRVGNGPANPSVERTRVEGHTEAQSVMFHSPTCDYEGRAMGKPIVHMMGSVRCRLGGQVYQGTWRADRR